MDLQGKRALITGGTKGIGAAVALDLASGGAQVAVNARNQDESFNALKGQIEKLGQACHFIPGDMAEPEQVERCVAQAAEALGGLDIVIHSAGGPSGGSIENVSTEQWNQTFAVHVDAAFHLCRHALPHLRKNSEGAILLISSAAGIRGCPGAITYGTVKGAVLQFTRALARDVADDNIRVNCVAPGIIRTRFHDAMSAEQQEHNLANRIPLHREGTVEDVAQVVRLLVTNEFMTGETVVVDGGMTMQIVR
ncbi:MAG: SDR family NAD(P)-dependent oxidoreductase [Planctomycetota bacterium]